MAKSLQRQIIEQARDLIANKERWAQGSLAENAQGIGVDPTSKDATQWCAIGAVRYVGAKMGIDDTVSVERALARVVHTGDHLDLSELDADDCEVWVAPENDDDTSPDAHADVLALFDLALEEVV